MAEDLERIRREREPGIEDLSHRKPRSKKFRLADKDGRRRWRQAIRSRTPMHYLRDGKLEDIDLTPREDRGADLIDRAPYVLRVSRDTPAYRYTNQIGMVQVELASIAGQPVVIAAPASHDLQTGYRWPDVAPETDYFIKPMKSGCATILTLRSDAAPKTWAWRVLGNAKMLRPIVGKDAAGNRCEIEQAFEGDILTATWNGLVTSRQFLRGKEPRPAVVWPVKVDPTTFEPILAGADDGFSAATTPFTSWAGPQLTYSVFLCGTAGGTFRWQGGMRFQDVDVPQGSTIDSAILRVTPTAAGGGLATIWADDVDNAAAWGAGSKITDITRTTESAIGALIQGNAFWSCANVVQEITDRSGWVGGNAMRFEAEATSGIAQIAALEHATLSEPYLYISFTSPVVAAPPGGKLIDGVLTRPKLIHGRLF
jgi:hypothetical protein